MDALRRPTSPATYTTSRLTPPPDPREVDDERHAFEDHGRGQEPVGPFREVAHIAPVRRHGCCQLLGGWFVGLLARCGSSASAGMAWPHLSRNALGDASINQHLKSCQQPDIF